MRFDFQSDKLYGVKSQQLKNKYLSHLLNSRVWVLVEDNNGGDCVPIQ